MAVARYRFAYAPKDQRATKHHLVPEWLAKGNCAPAVMNVRLAKREWFAGKRYSVADIALYAYTHYADEGGFDLSAFPAVERWMTRVGEQPWHIALSDCFLALACQKARKTLYGAQVEAARDREEFPARRPVHKRA